MACVSLDIVDAFADRPGAGNPAVIVPDAVGLSAGEMLWLTDELRMEGGFVLPASAPGADLRLRFFTPRREAMLSGHVLVAALVSLIDRGRFAVGSSPLSLQVETGRGVLPVSVRAGKRSPVEVTLDLPVPRFGEPVAADEVAAALGLTAAAVGVGDHGPQRVSCGFDVLVVPISDRAAARGAFEDMGSIRRLADRLGVGGLALFNTDTDVAGVDLFCRFFYPSEGTNEDVASGTSLGAVASYCLEKGIVPRASLVRIVSEQGHLLGRPNRATVEAHLDGRRITRIMLTAAGAVVLRGELRLDAESLGASG